MEAFNRTYLLVMDHLEGLSIDRLLAGYGDDLIGAEDGEMFGAEGDIGGRN